MNNVQSKIKTLSNEVKKSAGLILEEKASAENIQRNAELGSKKSLTILTTSVRNMASSVHELCHVKHSNHSPEFWRFYEDICVNEGLLLKRVLGDKRSLREIKIGNRLFIDGCYIIQII